MSFQIIRKDGKVVNIVENEGRVLKYDYSPLGDNPTQKEKQAYRRQLRRQAENENKPVSNRKKYATQEERDAAKKNRRIRREQREIAQLMLLNGLTDKLKTFVTSGKISRDAIADILADTDID